VDRDGEGRDGVDTREELRLEGLETEGDGRLRLEELRTLEVDRDGDGRDGVDTREELRLEGLETEGAGRLRLGALRTLEVDRDGEGRDGVDTREELRLEGLETEGDGRLRLEELCPRTLSTREEPLGTKRGDGRTGGADGAEGEDPDTDSAARGVELLEGVPRGIVPWVAVRRFKRRQRSSESGRFPLFGVAAAGRGGFTGPVRFRSTLLRPRTAAGFDRDGRLRRLVDPTVDLLVVVPGGRKPGAERPASGLVEERTLAGRPVWTSLRPRESTNRTISWRCWTKERRAMLRRARPVEKKRV